MFKKSIKTNPLAFEFSLFNESDAIDPLVEEASKNCCIADEVKSSLLYSLKSF